MLSISATIDRASVWNINRRMNKAISGVKNAKPLMRIIAQYLRRFFMKNMKSGLDPSGAKLAPVQKWTRIINKESSKRTSGDFVPLVNTGRLRAEMGPVQINNKSLIFGWIGKKLQIASNMIKGVPGRMQVKEEAIKRWYSGIRTTKSKSNQHQYIRYAIDKNGPWRTKQVSGGEVSIRPQARRFFYLHSKQAKEILRITNEYIASLVKK